MGGVGERRSIALELIQVSVLMTLLLVTGFTDLNKKLVGLPLRDERIAY